MYKRDRGSRGADSSAFEHVFVGEISTDFKSGEKIVKGFHNWIHVYQQEIVEGGRLNYRGYKKPRARGLNSLKHDLEEEQVYIARLVLDEYHSFFGCFLEASVILAFSSLRADPELPVRLGGIPEADR